MNNVEVITCRCCGAHIYQDQAALCKPCVDELRRLSLGYIQKVDRLEKGLEKVVKFSGGRHPEAKMAQQVLDER